MDAAVNDNTIELPLTEDWSSDNPNGHDVSDANDAMIRELVDAFYGAIRDDALLGPIFMSRVNDWSKHLSTMYDFWSTVALRSRRYAGRPLEVHARIPDLSEDHFKRWLGIWADTVRRHVPNALQDHFLQPAARMAYRLATSREQKAS